ncbi:dihydroxyacetone kinase subunit DhaK [Fundicoccus culcitae]|uniref:Dihydroxyacetone kinase subunit DhaK n=1 Tax=Fundicoccus culcitae TaxID=2969821 RepID=A0ABY5P420_9LACT|nr:dihydroxyacetone kinase subunit DhaK [Fundicoccus culcitae]UUX33432.1 dihydroxyacetone kinase subunit DhaK [Fundicoccus culcitae]
MKKIINQPENVVDEMINGIVRSNSQLLERVPNTNVIKQINIPNQVALVSGGGSGHEPAHAGFVGDGMLQAAVCGEVFTSPTSDQVYEAIKAVDQGQGVLLIIKNYSGDIMNFEMAQELAEMDDIKVGKVIVDDDIAVEDSTFTQGKRGVAGTVLVHKILGSAARAGASLDELVELGQQVVANIKTVGVALTGATVPEVGQPGFVLADDEIEFGVGIHGEPGYRKEKLTTSKEMASEIVEKLEAAFNWEENEAVGILVNGMGGTPLMEQFVFFNDSYQLLADKNLHIDFTKVGNFMTSIEMQGLSLTVIRLADANWLEHLEADVTTANWI